MDFFPGVAWPPDLCNPENLSHGLTTLLRGMGEEPLPRAEGIRAYRVSAQPTWGSRCCIRLEAAAGGWRVTGRRGFLPRDLVADPPQEFVERQLAAAESAEVEAALGRLSLWTQPVLVWDTGVDGVYWLAEGSDGGRFHAVFRRSPEEPEIREWCHLAHDLSGLGREEVPRRTIRCS